ncbi:uncharacterized protein LOC129286226 [Prosopis cineraria]|uniref:uncharacterized protein LOC129286226 n=1 Tax=Prosopis cineraria TaxID=364024 RepID=UPI00240FE7E5|nr:uncharacterized protein LOC129286226 [Prosopis cineraria]
MDAGGLENNNTPTPTHTPTPTLIPVSNTPSTHNVNATGRTDIGSSSEKQSIIGSTHEKTNPAWEHLALRKEGDTAIYTCLHCSNEYRGGGINRLKQHLAGENYGDIDDLQEVVDAGSNLPSYTAPPAKDKRKASTSAAKRQAFGAAGNYFAPRTTPGAQPTIDVIAAIRLGFKGPTAYDMRAAYINKLLVHCTKDIVFVKFIDALELVKDAKTLFQLFSKVIEWISPKNIVHVVTNNAANYVACGQLIHEKYRHIYWSSCAAHCLNLILKDIASLPHVSDLASKASKITIFVYNHTVFLLWLRKRQGWREIVRPRATRFASTFITLQSIYKHKNDLQALMVDRHFIDYKLSKTVARQNFANIVLDNRFWNECYDIMVLVGPFIQLLRIVDGDEKPSLGYVYKVEKEPAPKFNEADCDALLHGDNPQPVTATRDDEGDERMNATSSPPLFDNVGFGAQSTSVGFGAQSTPVGVRGQSTPKGVGVQSTPEVAISDFLPTTVANDLAIKELNLNEFYGDD